MAKLLAEDMVLFLLSFYIVVTVVANLGLFSSYYPNQQWDPANNSMISVASSPSPSIWSNLSNDDRLAKYGNMSNASVIDPGSIINPLGIVGMMGFYIGLMVDVLGSHILMMALEPFIGAAWSGIVAFVINMSCILVIIRVISGRLRWS